MDDELRKKVLRDEINVMLCQLRDLGFETYSQEIVDLELADLIELRRQFRDVLRTLGGQR